MAGVMAPHREDLTGPSAAWLAEAGRTLPRYTSYPTALAFEPADGEVETREWLSAITPDQALSVYVHVPFCRRLCWYCGCHTSVFHEYDRVGSYFDTLKREVDIWADHLPAHAGTQHLHFGGGSPNALLPEHFAELLELLKRRFAVRPDAEVAAELDPGLLTHEFVHAAAAAGVTRVSLGVQTFDPEVQGKVNRTQPFAHVAGVVDQLRAAGIQALSFDLMYGLPGQTPENVAESARQAVTLSPDRIAVFGYAHVPWMKKHQRMIRDEDLADARGRWAQAEAADATLVEAGYVRIGLDHYAKPDDPLTIATAEGRLRRNFQGYTDDPAPVLIPVGPSSIGSLGPGFVQNAVFTNLWGQAVAEGRLPAARRLPITSEDRLRAAVIERLMCDLHVDVGALCLAHGWPVETLDGSFDDLARLHVLGLCEVVDRTLRIPEAARRLMRTVAACFDARLQAAEKRHATAV
ncbi:oxygen-independent coproporphyrinogen III oxidase [Brevundimonas sp. 2R-24]|uniref:Coproporphyrinogen-III oxidase n=1 Tax=Peiella sedimenti TaxID=3061083 RepID=A0ABT8SM14_9CAUL|nr:oxygen-independent coproporphyrinogen III oxidase [Caulobacteraceae bacterium XZ-24]